MNQKENYLYDVSLITQIGKKSGKLFLSVAHSKIEGFLEILNFKQSVMGEINADGCILKGQLKTLVSVFEYTAIGYFDKKMVSFNLLYEYGTFYLIGSCVEYTIETQ